MNAARTIIFSVLAYLFLLGESALAVIARGARPLFAAPELGLFLVVYLGLSGRGGPVALTATALVVGYLRDLLIGAPRGVEALAFALIALLARALHGRVFLDRFGQLAVVCAGFALCHAVLVLLFGAGEVGAIASLRVLGQLMASAMVCGPILLRLLRRLDLRIAPEARSLRMDGELGGAWR